VQLITDGDLSTSGQPGSVTEFVQLLLPEHQDLDFFLNVTAVSEEKGNGDPDTASVTTGKEIKVDFTHNETHQTFDAIDQSIWTTGSGAPFTLHEFVGPNIEFNESETFPVPVPFPPFVLPVHASAEGHFKFGVDVNVMIDGGRITAHLPYDITIDTTYNETTDSLLIETGAKLAPGAGFTTTGPEGDLEFKFIVDFLAKLALEDGIAGVVGISETFPFQASVPLPGLSSTDPSLPYHVPLPAGLSIDLNWPHLSGGSTGQTDSQVLGEASSNNFFQANLDVDFAAAYFFPPFAAVEAILDPDPLSESNFELFDLDVNAGANLLQKFVLNALNLKGSLFLEDNGIVGDLDRIDFTVGDKLDIIRHASAFDGLDSNQTIDFRLVMDPDATLDNETSIGLNVGGQLGLLKNIPGGFTLFNEGLTIPVASIPLFGTDPFKLNFNEHSYEFSV
jgi:hypothetical protein